MKIAVFLPLFPALSETFILTQITGLIDKGYDIEIISFYRPKDTTIQRDVIKYKLLSKTNYVDFKDNLFKRIINGFYLLFANFLKDPIKIIKSFNIIKYKKESISLKLFYSLIPFLNKKFDVVHCHFGTSGCILANLKEIGIKCKIITSFHGIDANVYSKNSNPYLNLFNVGDYFTANTNYTRKKVIELGCNSEKISILPESLDLNKFKYRNKGFEDGEEFNIITIGRLVEKKGYYYSIKAISELVNKYNFIRYYIIGDGPLRKSLKDLIESEKLNNYVFLLGPKEQEFIVKFMNDCHIFILASITARNGDREGQALVNQEAQALGLPVISTIHNGIPEGLIDKKSGFLVPEKSSNEIAKKIEFFIQNPRYIIKMGKIGRAFVESKYDCKIVNNNLEKILLSL